VFGQIVANKTFTFKPNSKTLILAVVKFDRNDIVERMEIDPVMLFRYACKLGRLELSKKLLDKYKIDLSNKGGIAFRMACKHGHLNIVNMFVEKSGTSTLSFHGLYAAAERGHLEVVQLLVNTSKVDLSKYGYQALCYAANYGKIQVLDYLLEHPMVECNDDCLYDVIKYQQIPSLKRLLCDKRLRSRLCQKIINGHSRHLRAACKSGQMDMVNILLEADLNFTPNWDCILATVEDNHFEIFKFLLNHPKLDKSDEQYLESFMHVLLKACESGSFDIVNYLMENYAFLNPFTTPLDSGIRLAASKGYLDIVKLLCRIDRFQPIQNGFLEEALFSASSNGHTNVVEFLMAETKCDPSVPSKQEMIDASSMLALEAACSCGFSDIVIILLMDKRTDPNSNDNRPLRRSCENGRRRVVELLLQDPRIVIDNRALVLAADSSDVVRLLVDDGRFDPKYNNHECLRRATCGDWYFTARILLSQKLKIPEEKLNMKRLIGDLKVVCEKGDCIELYLNNRINKL
jgi:ankyrin repeat protein